MQIKIAINGYTKCDHKVSGFFTRTGHVERWKIASFLNRNKHYSNITFIKEFLVA
jgi:hypothetical protein